jgi:hypothetical protein
MAQGVQWSNINRGAKPNDNFNFLNCMIMMLADSVIYMLLTLYIENVFPGKSDEDVSSVKRGFLGEYGIPQRWYYPFTKTYWFGYDANKIRQRTKDMGQVEGNGHATSKSLSSKRIPDKYSHLVPRLFLNFSRRRRRCRSAWRGRSGNQKSEQVL